MLTPFLDKWHLHPPKTDFCYQAAKIRIRFMVEPQRLKEPAAIQTKSSKILKLRDI